MKASDIPSTATSVNVIDVLRDVYHDDSSAPVLTWYGPHPGERIELSSRVLLNWVSKTSWFFTDQLGCFAGDDTVALTMPWHWRACIIGLGAWATGLEVAMAGDESASVVFSDMPHHCDPSGEVVAVELSPLARCFNGDLPSGVIDFVADVLTMPDSPPAGEDFTLDLADVPSNQRIAIVGEASGHDDSAVVVARLVMSVLQQRSSVVLLSGSGLDTSAICASERVDTVITL